MWEYFCTKSLGEYEMPRDAQVGKLGSGGMSGWGRAAAALSSRSLERDHVLLRFQRALTSWLSLLVQCLLALGTTR